MFLEKKRISCVRVLPETLDKNLGRAVRSLFFDLVEEKEGDLVILCLEVILHVTQRVKDVSDLWLDVFKLWLLDWTRVTFLLFTLSSLCRQRSGLLWSL